MPGIPEQDLKEAARQRALLPAPAPTLPCLSDIWGNAMGPQALWTFLGGLWLLAGMENCGFGQGRWT